MKKRKVKQTTAAQYTIPLVLLLAVITCTILFNWQWIWTIIVAAFLICRWVYYLQGPKRSQQNIEEDKQWHKQQKLLKQEWIEKRKILGKESQYDSSEAFWEKYTALGLHLLEQKLKVGYLASAKQTKGDNYSAGDLLYDYFLGTTPVEKRRDFSSTQSNGYNGESSGGQSAGDYGGGSSGGGGATN